MAACNGLLRPIDSKAELALVSNALLNDEDIDPEQIVVSNGTDSVKQQSIITLNPGKWLTDEIISYYLKIALTQRDYHLCQQDGNRKRNHFFNSFFMLKLLDEKNDVDPNSRGKYNYGNVSRWGAKCHGKDIFKLKHIFVPFNIENVHWALAVIYMEDKKYVGMIPLAPLTKLD